jgi:hypothetical protein
MPFPLKPEFDSPADEQRNASAEAGFYPHLPANGFASFV